MKRKAPLTQTLRPRLASLPAPAPARERSTSVSAAPAPVGARPALSSHSALGGVSEAMGERSLRGTGFVPHDIRAPHGNMRVWQAQGMGLGPCVVFVHGLGGSSAESYKTLRVLQEEARMVLSIDLPGHGHSALVPTGKPDSKGLFTMKNAFVAAVTGALDRILHEPYAMVSHSLGSYVAMRHYVTSQGPQVLGQALVGPDSAPWSGAKLHRGRALLDVHSFADAWRLARAVLPGARFKAAAATVFIWSRFQTPALRALVHSDLFQPSLSPAQLAAQPALTWVVRGKREMMPMEDLAYFKRHLPRSHCVLQPDTGHAEIADTFMGTEMQNILRAFVRALPKPALSQSVVQARPRAPGS